MPVPSTEADAVLRDAQHIAIAALAEELARQIAPSTAGHELAQAAIRAQAADAARTEELSHSLP